MELKAAYLEDWMDTIESLPGELQRNFSLIRELDASAQHSMQDIETMSQEFMEKTKNCSDEERRQLLRRLSQTFSAALKHSEDKVTLACQTYDIVDKHIRRLDEDLMKFEDELTMTGPKISHPRYAGVKDDFMKRDSPGRKRKAATGREQPAMRGGVSAGMPSIQVPPQPPAVAASTGRKERRREQSVSQSDFNNNYGGNNNLSDSPMVANAQLPVPRRSRNADLKRKNSSAGSVMLADKRPDDQPVDPNEPTYCICNQVSYGAMIGCDNEDCEIEWFHYECVGLDSPPKGKWYCDDCRQKLGLPSVK